jgi:hypothetical protein
MLLYMFLIQNIYRGHRFGGTGVGTTLLNRGCSADVHHTEVPAPLAAGDALSSRIHRGMEVKWMDAHDLGQLNPG